MIDSLEIDQSFDNRERSGERSHVEKLLSEHQKDEISASFLKRQIHFYGNISKAVQDFLVRLILDVRDFATSQGLELQNPYHQIQFFDPQAYEERTGKAVSSKTPLPASKISLNPISKTYTVFVVLPRDVETPDELVNVTRTLFSRLFGDIYFHETLQPLEFYAQCLPNDDISTSIREKLEILATIDPAQQFAKQELKELLQSPETLDQQTQDKICHAFEECIKHFQGESHDVLESLVNKVKGLNKQLRFILPHQEQAYHFFEKQSLRHYLQSCSEKLNELESLSAWIQELFEQLHERLPILTLEGLEEQIYTRMMLLKQEGKVRVFLIESIELSEEQQRLKNKFPLLLSKLLIGQEPIQKWNQKIKQFEKHYQDSIYQKLFEALIYLQHWVRHGLSKQKDSFQQSQDYPKLKSLCHYFKFRLPPIMELKHVIDLCLDYDTSHTKQSSPFLLQDWKQAWSYFISAFMIYRYAQFKQQDPKHQAIDPTKYLRSTKLFLSQQIKQRKVYAWMASMLIDIAIRQKEAGLAFVLYLAKNPNLSLQYALCHLQKKAQESQDIAQIAQDSIESIAQTLTEAYENRRQQQLDE